MEIKAVANYCLDKRTIGLVYGPDTSGIGKTTALAGDRTRSWARAAAAWSRSTRSTPTHRPAEENLPGDARGRSRHQQAPVQAHLEHLTGRSHLLLIDQIHNLRGSKEDKPFYILADLFDATKTAQLWCGTADLVSYLQRQQAKNATSRWPRSAAGSSPAST
jgi:hypothetical protein